MRNEKEAAKEHRLMVHKLVKRPDEILRSLDNSKVNMMHHAVGISGEAGELLDAIKKIVIYNKLPDRENIVEELGDIEFYMEGLRREFHITREETLKANIAKLEKRYEEFTYSDESAQARADKCVHDITATYNGRKQCQQCGAWIE